VESIKSHSGSRRNAIFEVLWKSGDITWLPYEKVDHLTALEQYFELLGIENIDQLAFASAGPNEDDDTLSIHSIQYATIAEYGQQVHAKYISPSARLLENLFTNYSTLPNTHCSILIQLLRLSCLLSCLFAMPISHPTSCPQITGDSPPQYKISINLPHIDYLPLVYWVIFESTDPNSPHFLFTPSMPAKFLSFDSTMGGGNC
jgi:hypothetical protein